jgi:hypothetical protein
MSLPIPESNDDSKFNHFGSRNAKQELLQTSTFGNENLSRQRPLSDHSPVSVDLRFELSQKNTQNIWDQFESRLRSSTCSSGNNYQTTRPPKINRLLPSEESAPTKNRILVGNEPFTYIDELKGKSVDKKASAESMPPFSELKHLSLPDLCEP